MLNRSHCFTCQSDMKQPLMIKESSQQLHRHQQALSHHKKMINVCNLSSNCHLDPLAVSCASQAAGLQRLRSKQHKKFSAGCPWESWTEIEPTINEAGSFFQEEEEDLRLADPEKNGERKQISRDMSRRPLISQPMFYGSAKPRLVTANNCWHNGRQI